MKQWFKSVLYVPKHAKPTDENIRRLLVPSFLGILLCMVCLAGTTWAWFTASIQTQPQNIKAANYDITVLVNGEDDQALEKTGNGYQLSADTKYTITLTASGTANEYGGYCRVEGGKKPLYTTQLLPDKTLSFTLIPLETANYTFTDVWGKYVGEAEITNGCIIGQKSIPQPAPQASNPQQSTVDEGVYTVQPGDSLSKIAQQHGTTVEKVTSFNDIDRNAVLQIGQKIKIPPQDYDIPQKPIPSSNQKTESQQNFDKLTQTESDSISSSDTKPNTPTEESSSSEDMEKDNS